LLVAFADTLKTLRKASIIGGRSCRFIIVELRAFVNVVSGQLMRKYNRSETVVYTTMQAYLYMEDNIRRDLKIALDR